ncbi:hypothetical protein [Duganella sp. 1224]|uniref:hypothetical protein n=1 Tax=Duganella sp. 1224 TaxID=2587052 RepID=UPI0015CB4B96|nr:hypothetical protein [Duganella sp. 1224]
MAKTSAKPTPPTPRDAARVQSAVARQNGGVVPKGNYAARLQSASARHQNQSKRK